MLTLVYSFAGHHGNPRRRAERRASCPTETELAPWGKDPEPVVILAPVKRKTRVRRAVVDGEQVGEEAPAKAGALGAVRAQAGADAQAVEGFDRTPTGLHPLINERLVNFCRSFIRGRTLRGLHLR